MQRIGAADVRAVSGRTYSAPHGWTAWSVARDSRLFVFLSGWCCRSNRRWQIVYDCGSFQAGWTRRKCANRRYSYNSYFTQWFEKKYVHHSTGKRFCRFLIYRSECKTSWLSSLLLGPCFVQREHKKKSRSVQPIQWFGIVECFARGLSDFLFFPFRDSKVSNKFATLDGTFFFKCYLRKLIFIGNWKRNCWNLDRDQNATTVIFVCEGMPRQ